MYIFFIDRQTVRVKGIGIVWCCAVELIHLYKREGASSPSKKTENKN